MSDPKLLLISQEDYDILFPVSNHENELLLNNDIIRFDINFVSKLNFDKMGEFPIHIGPYPQNEIDIELMHKSGITAVLNVQSDMDFIHRQINWNNNLKAYKDRKIRIERYPIYDFNSDDLIKKLKGAGDLLHELIRNKHEVYVHCTAGMSRAAATVIIYLYYYQMMGLYEAYDYVKKFRSIICPNLNAIQQVIKNNEGYGDQENNYQIMKN